MKKYLIILGAGIAVTLGSCKKFLDVNTNPSVATQTNAAYVLSSALNRTYVNQIGGMHIIPGTWTGYYAHSTSFTGGGDEKTYAFTNSSFDYFSTPFDIMQDFNYVKQHAATDGVAHWADPAEIMQCYIYQQLVDLYGDVPYKDQTFQGATYITPKYTGQQAIYEDLIVRLDSSIARIKRTTWPTSGTALNQDIYFQGNKTNWIRFANTLKMRILMRQSFMPGRDAYITSNIAKIVTEGTGLITADVYCAPGYQLISGKLNPFYSTYGYDANNNVVSNHQYRKVNSVMINWLKTSLDTFRLQRIAWPAGAAVTAMSSNLASYVGVPLGATGSTYSTANSSAIGPMQISKGDATRPGIFFTLAEANFLKAEAAQRYATITGFGTAQTNYQNGIIASFELTTAPRGNPPVGTIADADAAAIRYYSRAINNVNWTASTDKIRAILLQKWVALMNVDGANAWAEYRKSSGSTSVGIPASVKSTSVSSSQPEPVRLYYPLTEENTNGNNTPKNINPFTTKIFWDVN